MSNDEKLMKRALEALKDVVDAEEARSWGVFGVDKQTPLKRARSAIAALRERLAQPEQSNGWVLREVLFEDGEPLGHREPTPLTKDEIRDGARKTDSVGEDLCHWSFECGVRFAEAAHGIKGDGNDKTE